MTTHQDFETAANDLTNNYDALSHREAAAHLRTIADFARFNELMDDNVTRGTFANMASEAATQYENYRVPLFVAVEILRPMIQQLAWLIRDAERDS